MYNQKLRPTHIFSGDIVDAHHAGVRDAKTYCTPTMKDADIVVANAYPQNAQAFHGGRWINCSVRENGTGVLIVQDGSVSHSRRLVGTAQTDGKA